MVLSCVILEIYLHAVYIVYISKMLFFSAIPDVRVTPRIQSRRPGEEAAMFCHVIGEPFPKVCIDLNYACSIFLTNKIIGILSLNGNKSLSLVVC